MLILSFVLMGRAQAGVINGDFQTGDLTGWDANTLNPPLTTPATVDVITVGSGLSATCNSPLLLAAIMLAHYP